MNNKALQRFRQTPNLYQRGTAPRHPFGLHLSGPSVLMSKRSVTVSSWMCMAFLHQDAPSQPGKE